MKDSEIIKILQSGDFTVYYTDNGSCDFLKGKHSSEDFENLDSKKYIKLVFLTCSGQSNGYIPDEVQYLVDALRGNVETV